VCGSGTLHHLYIDAAFKELVRVLKPNGCVVFFEPLGHNFLINLYRKLTPSMHSEDEHPLLAKMLNYFGNISSKQTFSISTSVIWQPFLADSCLVSRFYNARVIELGTP